MAACLPIFPAIAFLSKQLAHLPGELTLLQKELAILLEGLALLPGKSALLPKELALFL